MLKTRLAVLTFVASILSNSAANAEGEAGIISLRGQGHFYVGLDISAPAEDKSVTIKNQMYVGFQLPAEKLHPYPLILIHGGGGQASDWFSTPDGRDGWLDYFVAAGFDVYFVDRPGLGRSPANNAYGELGAPTSSQLITRLANSKHWPGDSADHNDPAILNWLAGSTPGPYAGNEIAAEDISELLDKTGPAILVTHSAGGISGWWALDQNPANVAGVIAIEPAGANPLGNGVRSGLTFEPELAAGFAPTKDADGCDMQANANPSRLSNYVDKPIHIVGAEMGLIAGIPCAVKALTQAGVNVKYTFLPDLGFTGNGHFMMAETNNGELAQVIINLAKEIK
ncbi:MAG: alpha/beta fold hydrolase [Pseudomonadota bacterium]